MTTEALQPFRLLSPLTWGMAGLSLIALMIGFGGEIAGAQAQAQAQAPSVKPEKALISTWLGRALEPCPFGYSAAVCASEINPGFEFIPVEGPVLLTGEVLGADAVLHTFRVEVELGLGLGLSEALFDDPGPSITDALLTIEAVLGHPRGWTARGDLAFQHVASGIPSLTILIARPETVDRLCAPLDTEGYFSCRNGSRAVLNVERWLAGVPHWSAGVEEYRAYLINHEVGHFLGQGHVSCRAPGGPAPVMQQQSISLEGCTENGWPYR